MFWLLVSFVCPFYMNKNTIDTLISLLILKLIIVLQIWFYRLSFYGKWFLLVTLIWTGITSSNAATCGLGAIQVQVEEIISFFLHIMFSGYNHNKDLYVIRSWLLDWLHGWWTKQAAGFYLLWVWAFIFH